MLSDLEKPIEARSAEQCLKDLHRRATAEPVAYIIGSTEFWSRRFQVSRDVLIPRPETELLVEAALERLPHGEICEIVDLGTGSGCIAVTLLCERPHSRALGIDISQAALTMARANATSLGVGDRFRAQHQSMLAWLESGARVDMIVSNPPYVSAQAYDSLAENVRCFEPRGALLGGTDGLDFYRAFALSAAQCLRPGGWLIVELGHDQGSDVLQLLKPKFEMCTLLRDLAGLDRVICAKAA